MLTKIFTKRTMQLMVRLLIFMYFSLFVCIYDMCMSMWECGCVCAIVHIWRTKDNLGYQSLFFVHYCVKQVIQEIFLYPPLILLPTHLALCDSRVQIHILTLVRSSRLYLRAISPTRSDKFLKAWVKSTLCFGKGLCRWACSQYFFVVLGNLPEKAIED